jgi:3-oxoadipate enol-lactonase
MSFTRAADGTRIHFEVSGRRGGEPLLMIQGLGADSRGWLLQKRAMGARYRCVLVDNRGVGRSDKPEGLYDLEVMAADAVACLSAAGFESAHVMGASMGGVIAQIIGVRHPERVRSLVLACTACRHLPWRRKLLHSWGDLALAEGMGAFTSENLRWLIGSRSLRRFALPFRLLGPLALNVPEHAFAAQVKAILAMDDSLRLELASIRVPTLVVVGSQDILTPRGDSEEIAELIPNAELAVVWGGAHGFMFENARTFNQIVRGFLRKAEAASERAAVVSKTGSDHP